MTDHQVKHLWWYSSAGGILLEILCTWFLGYSISFRGPTAPILTPCLPEEYQARLSRFGCFRGVEIQTWEA